MPVVCLNVFEKDGTIQCYSSSSDGLLSLVDVNVYPTLELHVNRILARPTGRYFCSNAATVRCVKIIGTFAMSKHCMH